METVIFWTNGTFPFGVENIPEMVIMEVPKFFPAMMTTTVSEGSARARGTTVLLLFPVTFSLETFLLNVTKANPYWQIVSLEGGSWIVAGLGPFFDLGTG
ncbi:MAG TPA: hypothetical protein VGW33_04770 [Terriglobia bacterium]|nr:hypothetical protein [Terriglobia bacterium]